MVEVPIRMVSSKNYWWVQDLKLKEGEMPQRSPSEIELLINLPKHSATIMKRMGDIGSPYQMPLEDLKKVEGNPLKMTKKEGVEMSWSIKLMTFPSKPKADNTLPKTLQSTQSGFRQVQLHQKSLFF